mmetsp:Transcript_25667/g.46339  ORF Transcript_25667/g.46339 Transcript_25667/m.46339 type:complete len:696 (-) Transcript_25667:636-2723(-)
MDCRIPLNVTHKGAPVAKRQTPVVGLVALCAAAGALFLLTSSTNSTMYYTVAPAATQVSTQVTTPVVSKHLATPFGSVNQPEIPAKYVPVHDVTTTGTWTEGNVPQGPSQLFWLAIPSIAVMFGWLMGRAVARKEEPVTAATEIVALAPVSANKLPFGKPEKMVKSGKVKALEAKGVMVPKARAFPSMHQRQRVRPGYEKEQPVFMEKLNELFPGSMLETSFIAKATKLMNGYGFTKDNSIGLLSVCRDEITRTLVEDFEELWGPSFSSGSLAGMAFLGKTGMGAGMAHAPVCTDGHERYIFLTAPHIAISADGEVGKCFRVGRANSSSACGALIAMQSELQNGSLSVQVNTMDMELSMMKQQLSECIRYGAVPSLDELTKKAQQLIKSQMEGILSTMNLTGRAEYCFLSGVQIHGPDNADFFWPTDMYVVRLDGSRIDVDLKDLRDADVSDLLEKVEYADLAKLLFVVQQGDVRMVKRWIEENGGDPNALSAEGKTPLSVAARHGHYEIVKYLLANGADPNIQNNRGRSALQEAMRHGHEAIADALAAQGCVLDEDVAAFYLWRGVREGDLGLVKRSLRYGPEGLMNKANPEGDRPVFAAVRMNNINVARWLIAYGADTTGTDMDANTILNMARRRGLRDIELQLEESSPNKSSVAKELLQAQEEMKALTIKFQEMQAELEALRGVVQDQMGNK